MFNHAKNGAEQTLIVQQVLPINMMSFADVLGLEPKEEDVLEPYRDGEKKIPGDVTSSPMLQPLCTSSWWRTCATRSITR